MFITVSDVGVGGVCDVGDADDVGGYVGDVCVVDGVLVVLLMWWLLVSLLLVVLVRLDMLLLCVGDGTPPPPQPTTIAQTPTHTHAKCTSNTIIQTDSKRHTLHRQCNQQHNK